MAFKRVDSLVQSDSHDSVCVVNEHTHALWSTYVFSHSVVFGLFPQGPCVSSCAGLARCTSFSMLSSCQLKTPRCFFSLHMMQVNSSDVSCCLPTWTARHTQLLFIKTRSTWVFSSVGTQIRCFILKGLLIKESQTLNLQLYRTSMSPVGPEGYLLTLNHSSLYNLWVSSTVRLSIPVLPNGLTVSH